MWELNRSCDLRNLLVGQIKSPSKMGVDGRVIRELLSLIFLFAPMLSVLILFLVSGVQINLVVALFRCFLRLCFILALILFNDFNDHKEGQDRLRGEVLTVQKKKKKWWVSCCFCEREWPGLFFVAGLFGLPAYVAIFSFDSYGGPCSLGLAFAWADLSTEVSVDGQVMAFCYWPVRF